LDSVTATPDPKQAERRQIRRQHLVRAQKVLDGRWNRRASLKLDRALQALERTRA
jgi:hypothetical protein